MRTHELDGDAFETLEGFYAETDRALCLDTEWGHNLDAFNDVLRGGFGTPGDGFVLRWNNHQLSRQRLGYSETMHQLEARLARCHPENRADVARELDAARRGEGPTVFHWLGWLIRRHGPGGDEADDNVILELD